MTKLETLLGSIVLAGSVYLIHNAYSQKRREAVKDVNELQEYVKLMKEIYREAIET